MQFANLKVKLPFLNAERNNGPNHTAWMRLWSNCIRFCKDRVLCRGSSAITCVSAEQRQGNGFKLHALLIETTSQPYQTLHNHVDLFLRMQ